MSAEPNKNVQIAASNLSLADLEKRRQQARQESQPRFRSVKLSGETSSSGDRGAGLEEKLGALNPSQVSPAPKHSPESPLDDMIVVSIPAIGDPNVLEIVHPEQGLENRLQRIPPKVHPVPFVDETQVKADPEELPERPAREVPVVGLKIAQQSQPRADLSETPDDWLPNDDKGEKRNSKQAKPLETPQQAFKDLTDKVLDDFPLGPSSVLLVADVDGKSSGYAVAYQLAHQLAERKVGKVLVVDSHFEDRELSERLALGNEVGLADILATGKSLDETICETNLSNLEVLPVGTETMCRKKSPESPWIADNIRALRDEYQFVIVFVGNVFHRSTAMWAKHCDASYMAIELGASNQTVAKSGVVRLQQFGARLMGCVVTDAAA